MFSFVYLKNLKSSESKAEKEWKRKTETSWKPERCVAKRHLDGTLAIALVTHVAVVNGTSLLKIGPFDTSSFMERGESP